MAGASIARYATPHMPNVQLGFRTFTKWSGPSSRGTLTQPQARIILGFALGQCCQTGSGINVGKSGPRLPETSKRHVEQ
eukprot:14644465-Alexandrium_andersonii.AAC.1